MRESGGRVSQRAPVLAVLAAAALLSTGLLAACDSSGSSSATSSPSTPSTSPLDVRPATAAAGRRSTFGVVGSAGEIDAVQDDGRDLCPAPRQVTVKVESWPNDAAMLAAFRDGEQVPDVFLANRRHLPYLLQHQLVQPVDQLLDDRGFDFGDEYPRSSLTAFGADNRLECLPYGVQPSVVFYNKKLVRFGQMRNDPPEPGQGWSLDQFAAAGRWAVGHHPGIAGIYLAPDLSGLAPFVYSGGGDLFDNATTRRRWRSPRTPTCSR